jgi:peptidoglycan hydrolase-like protein with peptidoglycan-binding domain
MLARIRSVALLVVLAVAGCTSATPSGSPASAPSSAPTPPPTSSPTGGAGHGPHPSDELTALQLDLQALGFFGGKVTGIFDDSTVRALRTLQESFGLPTTGELDPDTAAAIDAARGRDTESAVSSVQTALTELGYHTGLIDGDYGPATTRAMRRFQSDFGIEPSGAFDAGTATALFRAYQHEVVSQLDTGDTEGPNEPGSPHGPILRVGSSGPKVRALQERLKDLGFRPGAADGEYGATTASAVMAFQKFTGLDRDGVAGPAVQGEIEDPHGRGPHRNLAAPRIEIDLDRQIAFIVDAGGDIAIVNISSGSGETYETPGGGTATAYTPTGRFSVVRRIDGIREAPLGSLYRPLYFYLGWAVHGSTSVPGYPASHGCVRTSYVDQDYIFDAIPDGALVILYGKSQGGAANGEPGF